MASPTRGRSSARSSKAQNKPKQRKRRPGKQAGKKPERKRHGGNPKGKGHRSSTTWQQGQSGNPAGRPKKGDALSDIAIAKMELRDVHDAAGKRLKRKDALVEMIYNKAIQQRDMAAFNVLREMLSHAGAEIDEPQTTEAAVYAGVLAFLRKIAEKHPDLKQELIDGLADTRSST